MVMVVISFLCGGVVLLGGMGGVGSVECGEGEGGGGRGEGRVEWSVGEWGVECGVWRGGGGGRGEGGVFFGWLSGSWWA